MTQLQRGFEKNPRQSPTFRQEFLRLGKVVKSDPEGKTVDVTLNSCGGTLHKVPVLCPFTSTSSGISHLPKPHNPRTEDQSGYDAPVGYEKRDVYAIVGFVEGHGGFPVVLGFKHPDVNQQSFPDSVGANQKLDRHEGDRYHRITGDTVAENGGEDVPSEEEIRYPDHSFFKVVKAGGSRNLEDLSQANRDKDLTPFQLKKEGSKGYYFQHVSGSRVFIGFDGEIKISHQAGSWISIAPDTGDLPPASAGGKTINSKNDPPAAPNTAPAQFHVGHSSGTYFTIDAGGKVTVFSSNIALGSGSVRKLLDERAHTYMGGLVSALNSWLNNHDHDHGDPAGTTTKPNQTASLSGPPVISQAATTNTLAS